MSGEILSLPANFRPPGTMGEICLRLEEQRQLADIINAHIQQVSVIFLVIGFVVGLLAGGVYIYLTYYHGR
jgi:hypothetical protein